MGVDKVGGQGRGWTRWGATGGGVREEGRVGARHDARGDSDAGSHHPDVVGVEKVGDRGGGRGHGAGESLPSHAIHSGKLSPARRLPD